MDQLSLPQSSKRWTVERLQRDRRFKKLFKKKFFINTLYGVPNFVGMSKNGKTIYIDKKIEMKLNYRQIQYDVSTPLMVYQVVYTTLIHQFDIEPHKAKMLAKRFEKMCTDRAGIPWNVYVNHLRKYERAVPITECAPDFRFFFGLERTRPKMINRKKVDLTQDDLINNAYS